MQSPSIWGPKLWAVLHSVGSRSGRSHVKLRIDEIRELNWMIHNLETIVPCNECRIHIEEYRKHTPPPQSDPEKYNLWIWNFHESVNHRLGKTGVPFPIGVQKRVFEAWKEFTAVVKIPTAFLKNFERHLRLWAGFAGL